MFGKSAFVVALTSVALMAGCHASFQAGSQEPAAAPTTPAPPPPPPPPVVTAAPAPAPAPEAPKSAEVDAQGKVGIPGQIEFDTGKATFKAGGNADAIVDQVKLFLDQHKNVTKLRIEGHTDNVGTDDANLTLSGQRALTVKNAAIAKGVDKARLIAVGFGSKKPIVANDTEEHKAQNRRTEFRIAGMNGKPFMGLAEVPATGKLFE